MTTRDWHLIDENGRPFFWLADTAWNLWCRGTPAEWDNYLAQRATQGFNVIQFVAGWWRGCMQPLHGRPFDLVDKGLVINEESLTTLDRLFERIQAHGLVASPIMLWTLTDIDPGQVLSEDQCVAVASTQYQRWKGSSIVWLLGGDGDYSDPNVEARWKRIGRRVFGERPDHLATLHPCGTSWVAEAFSTEPWYRIATIQSGHGSSNEDLSFLLDGGYARSWRTLRMPFLNLEPNYEDARSYGERLHFRAFHVRRAAYWSLLVAPPAGITYGIGSVWMWANTEGEIAENHDESWIGQPWQGQLDTPGAASMSILRKVFEALPWTELRPDPCFLAEQPGRQDLRDWVAASRTVSGDTVVVYSPNSAAVSLAQEEGYTWEAIDPSSGNAIDCSLQGSRLSCGATAEGDRLFIGRR